MRHASRPQHLAWFQEHYKNGRLVLRPPFQRKAVWSMKQKCALIESILMDIPIPEVYVHVTSSEDGQEEFGVVDGQQRLRTILEYVGVERETDQEDGDHNSFRLESLPSTSIFKDKAFSDIAPAARRNFFQYEVCVRFLYTDDQKKVEDVFKRLNKFTMPLKPQELRNATYHGPFAILSEQLADDEYWAVNRIVSPAAIRRMSDIEMMSDLLIGLLHGPQGGSAKVLDQYYEEYEQYEDEFPEQTRVKRLFLKTLEVIKTLFPDIDDVPRWGNRADFYTLFVAFGVSLHENKLSPTKEKSLRRDLIAFAKDVDHRLEDETANVQKLAQQYARAVEKGVNDRARRVDRHEALTDLLRPFLVEK